MSESLELDLYEISGSHEPEIQMPVEGVPRPRWLGEQPPRESEQDAGGGEVDEDGHRIVLIDGETFTVVEGDLVLDIDQKELWQEALNIRQSEFNNRLRLQTAGFGEAAINQNGIVSSALVGIVEGGKLVRWSPQTVLSYCVLKNTFPRLEWY